MTPKERGKPLLPPCQVTRVRFSPDGTTLAAACTDGVVRRWTAAGEPLPDLKGHNGWVSALAFLPTGDLLSADTWGRLTCWRGDTARWTVPAHDGWLRAVAVHANALATVGRDGRLVQWDANVKVREVQVGPDLFAVTYTPDGRSIVVGDLFGTIRVFDAKSGAKVREIERKEFHLLDRIQDVGGVRCLVFSPDGKTLYAAGCQPKTGAFVQAFPLLLAIDFAGGQTLWTWKGASDNEGILHDLRVLPDGRLAGVTSGQPGQGKFLIWQPLKPEPVFVSAKQPNCHSLDVHGNRIAVSATNANSSGNGRVKGKSGEYPANTSPIQMWEMD